MSELPTGTVTFLITDLEGSTRLWEQQPDAAMRDALARHDAVFQDVVARNNGVVYNTMGDGVLAVFASAVDAVAAALEAQQQFAADADLIRARIGLHSDEGRFRAPGTYVNRPINRSARLMAVAHGGQTLLSGATAALARDDLPDGAHLVDLGSHGLRDLAEPVQVFQLVHASLPDAFPPLRSLESAPGNLPRQVTTFIGREREVDALRDLVRARPLVTLTGVGGVGKTRLALQVAAEVVPDFPDGTWLCELAPVLDPGLVWDAVGAGVRAPRQGARAMESVVAEYLAEKRALVVLDNCEHLLDAVARVAAALAQDCPGIAVLATSREGLAIAGEQIVAVPSLALPSDDTGLDALNDVEAVRLFCDRAHDANAHFEVSDRNAAAIAQLCRRLDGIPLAIELAAARSRSLSPEELVSRLDQRFKLLTRGSRGALERHQTLRNTIDWSYDLLTPEEQDGLRHLSVFVGGCTLYAAEALLDGDAIDVIAQLVEKSLVLADDDDDGTRYRMLETIRQYAQERLEETGHVSEVRRRHAEHFIAVAEAARPGLRGRGQIETAARLARDTDNFRAALEWAIEAGSADHALRLLAPIVMTSTSIGWNAMEWSAAACEIPGAADHPRFPHVCAMAALDAALGGELERGDALVARAAASERGLGVTEPWLFAARGTIAMFAGHFDACRAQGEAWVAWARPTGDPYDIAHALALLGSALRSDPPNDIPVLEETIEVARAAGISSILAIGLMTLGFALPPEESVRALALLAEAAEITVALGDRYGAANVLNMRNKVAIDAEDWLNALSTSVAVAEEMHEIGQRSGFGPTFIGAAEACTGLGELEPAVVMFGYAGTRHDFAFTERERWEMRLAELESALGRQRFEELRARGAAMSPAEIVAYLRTEAERILAAQV